MLDLSHTDTVDADLSSLLELTPSLVELDVNFCDSLTDSAIEAMPPSISRWRKGGRRQGGRRKGGRWKGGGRPSESTGCGRQGASGGAGSCAGAAASPRCRPVGRLSPTREASPCYHQMRVGGGGACASSCRGSPCELAVGVRPPFAVPPGRLGALGCVRLSFVALQQLGKRLQQLRSDDSFMEARCGERGG